MNALTRILLAAALSLASLGANAQVALVVRPRPVVVARPMYRPVCRTAVVAPHRVVIAPRRVYVAPRPVVVVRPAPIVLRPRRAVVVVR